MRFSSREALREYVEELKQRPRPSHSVWVCGGPGCAARGSLELAAFFEKRARELFGGEVGVQVETGVSGCMGPCGRGPVVHLEPEGRYYERVTQADAEGILAALKAGGVYEQKDITNEPLLAKQHRIVLAGADSSRPLDLDAWLLSGGFEALAKALFEMTPEQINEEVAASGLRGRSGGGFPAGRKWEACRKAKGGRKYALVNGDEGNPGAFVDQSVMEGRPYAVLEGLEIGAFCIGASEGVIYVRHEYPQAIERLREAIAKLEEAGLLGADILGSGFSFHAEICEGGGAFVCGESTALMTSIEGKAGVPRVKYVRSAEKGLWESPTILNNVETWANVPAIIRNGAAWFKQLGTEKSSGTKLFSVVGDVRDPGLVEVPMGVTLRQIVCDLCGGMEEGRRFKAIQTGGPSGGCLPERLLDTPVDFDSLTSAGSMMGAGGMIVMDDSACMVDMARHYIDFLVDESCGKCIPCREGLKKMQTILHDLTEGRGRAGDTRLLAELAAGVSEIALCGLGQSAQNPVLSTITHFPEEYEEHEKEHFCRAGVCAGMKGGARRG